MANRPSRLVVDIPTASANGRYYGAFPHGDAPVIAHLQAAVTSALSTTAALKVGAGLAGAAILSSTASASLTTGGGGGGVPSAPTIGVPVQFGALAAMSRWTPPASPGSSNILKYRTYVRIAGVDQGFIETSPERYQDGNNTVNWQQLNCRTYVTGLTGGTTYTFQVSAFNTAGEGPRSADSTSITVLAAANYYMACGGGISARNPNWSDYSFNYSALTVGVPPGQTSALYGQSAPTNPGNPTDNVVELCIASGVNGAAWFPHVGHIGLNGAYDASQNGNFSLLPYKHRIVKILPSISGLSLFPNGCDQTLIVHGVATANTTGSLVDATQSAAFGNPGWPAFANGTLVFNLTKGSQQNATGNTATSVTGLGAQSFSIGDYYEISIPDVAVGQTIGSIASLTAGIWNSVSSPLTDFDGGGGPYTAVSTAQILKTMCAFNAPSSNAVIYICQDGFSPT